MKFRILYGGTEYSFAKDPDFTPVSTSKKFWANVIEKYYSKYKGIAAWHNQIISEVGRTGKLIMPTGRQYAFEMKRNWRGDLQLPVQQIKNYPVQGFGADVVSILRVMVYKRSKKYELDGLLINTVHDSIVVDCPREATRDWIILFKECFEDLPKNIEKVFGFKFDMKIRVEIMIGKNQYNLHKVLKT